MSRDKRLRKISRLGDASGNQRYASKAKLTSRLSAQKRPASELAVRDGMKNNGVEAM